MKTNLDILHDVYEQYKDNFEGSFHTVLWRVMVDNCTNGKVCCFVTNYTKFGLQMGIAYANERGYTPCPAYFKPGIKHDDASDIIDKLNELVFKLSEDTATHILMTSMAN